MTRPELSERLLNLARRFEASGDRFAARSVRALKEAVDEGPIAEEPLPIREVLASEARRARSGT